MIRWSFKSINEWNEIWSPSHLSKWRSILDGSPSAHVFFHPTLVHVWVDTYLPIRRLSPIFVWAKGDDGTEGFLPLVIWGRNWKNAYIRLLIPIGYSDYDYHNPVFSTYVKDMADFWSQLHCYLKENYSYDKLCIDGITDYAIDESSEWKQNEICPYLNLAEIKDEEQLMKFFVTSLRGDLRRQMRRLSSIGQFSFKRYKDWQEAKTTFADFMTEHRHKWPCAYKAPLFHQKLLEYGLADGIVHFSSVNISDRPVSWHLGFCYKKRFYYYMPVGNRRYATYSPVKVHLFCLVKWAMETDCNIFDHLRGDETYKTGWSNGYQHVYSYTKKTDNLMSQLKFFILKLRH